MGNSRRRRIGEKILHAPSEPPVTGIDSRRRPSHTSQPHIALEPERVERDLARLVLGLVELLRQLIERQAVRRVDSGRLSEEEIERLGQTLLKLEARMTELKAAFGLEDRELALAVGALQQLVDEEA